MATPPANNVLFADAAARDLLGAVLPELRSPDGPRWRQVKHNDSRTVYRGQVRDTQVYLKHFHGASLPHRLGRALGRGPAVLELRQAQYLRAHGVPTPQPLAAAHGRGGEWLATRAVTDAVPADRWHAEQLGRGAAGRRAVRNATRQLAGIVARMHAAGVLHGDLHCANVLVATGGDVPRLFVTDLHRVRRRWRLSRRQRAANLAHVLHDRYELTTRTERLRFLKQYVAAADAGGTLRGWQRRVEAAARRHRRRQWAQRDRRVRGRNRYFASLRLGGGWRARVVLASKRRPPGSVAAARVFAPAEWARALAEPAGLLDAPGVDVLRDGRSARLVRRTLRVGDRELDVFCQQRHSKHWAKRLLDAVRPSRAARGFRRGHELLTRHVATALPLAALERRAGPFCLESILITEGMEAPRLSTFLETWLSARPPDDVPLQAAARRRLARDVLWQLGRLLRRLHDSNYAHRNLKAENILVRWSGRDAPHLLLLELDGLRRVRFLSARARFQGLMRLNVSLLKCPVVNRAGRLRMLVGYLRRPGRGRINFKPYWRLLEDWSARALRRRIRSRRKRQRVARGREEARA